MSNQQVDLHVDAACPWCWLTALWLFEVERVRPISITTRVFSLREVNSEHRDALEPAEHALRVLVAARRVGGEQAIRAVYRELGEAHHERDEPLGEPATLAPRCARPASTPTLAETALADDTTLTEVLAEHAAVVERGAFGVPTLVVDGSDPYFGPIVDRRDRRRGGGPALGRGGAAAHRAPGLRAEAEPHAPARHRPPPSEGGRRRTEPIAPKGSTAPAGG